MSDISQSLRNQVLERARSRCEYCQIPIEGQIAWFPVDHVIPRVKGGETELENLALSCPRCNGHKWAFDTGVDPESGREERLFNPRSQIWIEHFGWPDTAPMTIQGLTPVGRATVNRLKLNEPEVVKIRSFLLELGIEVISRNTNEA